MQLTSIEVTGEITLRDILMRAKQKGLTFGFGAVTLRKIPVSIDKIGSDIGTYKHERTIQVVFKEIERPTEFDLDSMLT